MCMACEMEAMWFAAMEARAQAIAAEAGPPAILPLLPEGGRVGEAGDPHGMSAAPVPNPPTEEAGGGTAPARFACEETQAE